MWLRKHCQLYTAATRHSLILRISESTVDLECFRRWLEHDYLLYMLFATFFSSVLIKAEKQSDMKMLLGRIARFQEEAVRWGIQLPLIIPREITLGYCQSIMKELMKPEVEYDRCCNGTVDNRDYQLSFAFCQEDRATILPKLIGACERGE